MCFDHEHTFWSRVKNRGKDKFCEAEALAASAVQMSFEIGASIIICFTATGYIARLIAKYRPSVNIVAISTEDKTIKGLSLSSGVTCLRVPSFQGIDTLIDYAIKSAKGRCYCETGQKAVILLGGSEEDPDMSNILKIKTVI
jgi:pyruvate kinase